MTIDISSYAASLIDAGWNAKEFMEMQACFCLTDEEIHQVYEKLKNMS